jgi:hypothetical protein
MAISVMFSSMTVIISRVRVVSSPNRTANKQCQRGKEAGQPLKACCRAESCDLITVPSGHF